MMRTLGTALLLMVLPALLSAQSLGQVAEKEKERRKQNEKAGTKAPVITEDELKNNKGRLANNPSEPGAAAAGTTSSAPITPPTRRDEQAWRSRAAQARARLAQATRTYETLNGQYLAPGERFVSRKTGQTVVRDKEQLQAMVAQAKANMMAAQKALDDLEDSARRQSIPPGWLR
jgi:cell pole-organizing protein PopZ